MLLGWNDDTISWPAAVGPIWLAEIGEQSGPVQSCMAIQIVAEIIGRLVKL